MIDYPLLSLLIWLPIAGGVLLLVLDAMGNTACRQTALIIAIATFLLSTQLYTHFDFATAAMQFQENIPWIDAFSPSIIRRSWKISTAYSVLCCMALQDRPCTLPQRVCGRPGISP